MIDKYNNSLKFATRVFITLLIICMFTVSTAIACGSSRERDYITTTEAETIETFAQTEIVEALNDTAILFTEIKYDTKPTIELCNEFIADISECITKLDSAIASGTYTSEAFLKMQKEEARLYGIIALVKTDIERYTRWENEYYYAAKTWEFFRQHGYNEAVTSAIIGNMMVETGGYTLYLKPTIYDSSHNYYGLCQWSLYYRPEVRGMSFEEQLNFLHNGMYKEFRDFGNYYKSGFTYENFLSMTDPKEAALAFAKVYERCSSSSYNTRKIAAQIAYNYFTS